MASLTTVLVGYQSANPHCIENWFDKVIKKLKITPNILFTQKLFSLTKICAKLFAKSNWQQTKQSAKTDCMYILYQSWSDKNWPVCFILQESASCRHVPFLHVHTYLTEYIVLYTSLIKILLRKSSCELFYNETSSEYLWSLNS